MSRMTILLVTVSACSIALAGAAFSAGHMQPGLWKMSNTVDMAIPPQILAQMKAAGITPPGGGQPMVSQMCVTAAQAAMDTPPIIERDQSGCSTQNVKASGNKVSADMVCTGQIKGKGHMETAYSGAAHYQGTYSFEGTAQGQPQNMNMTFTGDFVAASCGSVKPVQ